MKISPSLISIWFKPRTTIAAISQQRSRLGHFPIIALITFLLIMEAYFFLWLMDFPKFEELHNWNGLILFLISFLFIGIVLYTILTSSALFVWIMAKSLKGQADIFTTRTALLWSIFTLLPVGIISSLTLFVEKIGSTFDPNILNRPQLYILLEATCFVVFFGLLFYGLLFSLKGISEVHKISILRAIIPLCLGVLTGILFVVFLINIALRTFGIS